jgi:hypothetical protein
MCSAWRVHLQIESNVPGVLQGSSWLPLMTVIVTRSERSTRAGPQQHVLSTELRPWVS